MAESPLEGESVAPLTLDPAMLHKTQLTTPHRGCVRSPLYPQDLRDISRLTTDIFHSVMRWYGCGDSARCTPVSPSSREVSPVWSNCRGDFTRIQGVILDPPSRPVSIRPSLPPNQPIACFCLPCHTLRTTSSSCIISSCLRDASRGNDITQRVVPLSQSNTNCHGSRSC